MEFNFRGPPIILFIAVILKHLLLLFLTLLVILSRPILFLLLHLLNLTIDFRDLRVESHEQPALSPILVGGGATTPIVELLKEGGGGSLVLLLVQSHLPIPHM